MPSTPTITCFSILRWFGPFDLVSECWNYDGRFMGVLAATPIQAARGRMELAKKVHDLGLHDLGHRLFIIAVVFVAWRVNNGICRLAFPLDLCVFHLLFLCF